MSNVPPMPNDETSGAAPSQPGLALRVTLWVVAGVALAVVFFGYQQVDLAITWITAKLC